MKTQSVIFLIFMVIMGCTTAPPPAPATSTPPSIPEPTLTLVATQTSAPLPTFASTPTKVSLPAGQKITFDESGERSLTGTLYGEGATAILLANMSIGGQKQWAPLVAAVDPRKFTTVTFDYSNINDVGPDMDRILEWLREQDYTRVICIGASLGTRACSSLTLEPEVVGLVLIAGPVHHASVAEATYPKLFASGALDPWAFDIQMGYERAAQPKDLVLFEDNRAHGTDLFSSTDGGEFLNLLLDFVNSLEDP